MLKLLNANCANSGQNASADNELQSGEIRSAEKNSLFSQCCPKRNNSKQQTNSDANPKLKRFVCLQNFLSSHSSHSTRVEFSAHYGVYSSIKKKCADDQKHDPYQNKLVPFIFHFASSANFFSSCRPHAFSPINFSAMAHAMHAHDAEDIRNFVNHAIVADANAPVIFRSRKFPAARWPGILCELLNRGDDAVVKVVREPSQILFGRAFEQDSIHAIWIFSARDNPRAGDNAAASGVLA